MTIASDATRLHAEIRREIPDLIDMRGETHLELSMIGAADPDARPPEGGGGFTRIEDEPIIARPIGDPAEPSQLRFFLDGAQRTLLFCLLDTIPVVTCISAAGILQRDGKGVPTLMPGTLRLGHHWIVPMASGNPKVDRLVEILHDRGASIVDPLARLAHDPDAYTAGCEDYPSLVDRAYGCGTEQRAAIERDLLEEWIGRTSDDDGWIVVDGALKGDPVRAVGLVKSFTRQYLTGPEANTLFRLEQKHRTSAFHVRDKWREGTHTCWYQRFWNPAGRDVRHALVRVETSSRYQTTDEIDRLASWLMVERLPRATADQRWATLLYPVHYLERILKRKLDAETRGWPAAR